MPTVWESSLGWLTIASCLVVGAWESFRPLATLQISVTCRWLANFILFISVGLLFSALLRNTAIEMIHAQGQPVTNGILFFLIADFVSYAMHALCHHVRFFWLWHSIHHSDLEMDSSTGLRFHPLEALLTEGTVLILIWIFKPSIWAYLALEWIKIPSNFFVHINSHIPPRLEALLSTIFMTPGLHRPHHGLPEEAQKGNYGIILSIWDRLFGTLHAKPYPPQFGIENITPAQSTNPLHLLFTLPWREFKRL
jgi:sterol desaturase/sphingolipid hydroxylase (fatty acid hydroxylase superfamily)